MGERIRKEREKEKEERIRQEKERKASEERDRKKKEEEEKKLREEKERKAEEEKVRKEKERKAEEERARKEKEMEDERKRLKERARQESQKDKLASEALRRTNDGTKKRLDINEEHKRISGNFEEEIARRSAPRKSESDRNSGDYSRYKTVISPSLEVSRDSNFSVSGHKTPDVYKYDAISPTFDGRSRNISGDYREAVEK